MCKSLIYINTNFTLSSLIKILNLFSFHVQNANNTAYGFPKNPSEVPFLFGSVQIKNLGDCSLNGYKTSKPGLRCKQHGNEEDHPSS